MFLSRRAGEIKKSKVTKNAATKKVTAFFIYSALPLKSSMDL